MWVSCRNMAEHLRRREIMAMKKNRNIIIGSGPAGMACAYVLAKAGKPYNIVDEFKDPGGLCRTIDFNGYLFDIGGPQVLD